jgi:hypothetical protein
MPKFIVGLLTWILGDCFILFYYYVEN